MACFCPFYARTETASRRVTQFFLALAIPINAGGSKGAAQESSEIEYSVKGSRDVSQVQ